MPSNTQIDDFLVASIAFSPDSSTIDTPAGWTLLRKQYGNGSNLAIYYHIIVAGEPTSYSWKITKDKGNATTGIVGGILAFRGVDITSPINVENSQTTQSSLSHSTPNITTTIANTMLLATFEYASSRTWTPPVGMTESVDVASAAPSAGGVSLEMAYQIQTSSGNVGNKTATASGYSDTGATEILALTPAVITPLADYRFGACSWSGVSGEVKDSSGNGYNGTAINGADTNSSALSNGGICRVGQFDATDKQYIELQDFPALSASRTITAWINVSNLSGVGRRIFADDKNNQNGDYALSYGDPGRGRIRFYIRGLNNVSLDSNAVIEADKWYFVAATFNDTTMKKYLYIYNASGDLVDTQEDTVSGTLSASEGHASIGGELSSGGESNLIKFDGFIDEVKVFSSALSQSSLASIMGYEKNGKNYDGTTRTCSSCFALQECYYDDFNRANLGDKWSIISTGTYPPDITNNKLMLTKNYTNIASGVSLVGSFPAQNNLIQIEFEDNAYAGGGADGASVILSDANITPVSGGFGGSLGYAPRYNILGFAGGWLGFGLDEFGNFANDDDGNKGSGCSNEATNRILDSITIRGAGSSNRLDGYCFIANSGNLETSTGVGIDDKSSTDPAPKSKYKFIIDTRNSQTLITVYRDTNDGNGYVLLPNMNEVNATQSASSPENFRFSLTGSTGSATNYHSLDDLNISAANCGTLGQLAEDPNSYFDAWEIGSSYNVSNRVIKTKIVKENFDLNIFALNESNTDYQDFNGTVCARVVDSGNYKALSSWVKLLFDDTNPYVNVATFNSDYASKDARINLFWKKNVDTTCPISDEDNSTLSSDHFAIRPLKFTMETNATSFYAGVPFRLDINASNNSGDNSLDYNETNGTSYTISISDSNATCPSGSLENVPDPIQFSNGGVRFTPKYSDVGDVNITIKENSGSEFAYIDHNDSSDTERLIPTLSKTITFNPYRFAIINASFVRDPNQDWRYMANVDDANISLSFKVQAQNADGDVTKKFDRQCYSHDVGVTIDVNATSSDGNISYAQFINNTLTMAHDKNLSSPDFNETINDQNFTEGNSSLVMYVLNVYRQYNIPKDPLTITMEDINTSYPTDTNVLNPGLVLENNDSQFYYGRVKTHDIDTNQQSAQFDLRLEVYSSASTSYVSGFHQDSTHWYQMQKDSSTLMMALLAKKDFTISENESDISTITPTQSILLGIDSFTISNVWTSSDSAYIHVKAPDYLWYNNYKDYNDNNTSDCSTHPCFKYNYFHNSTSSLIQSGDFNGTSIGNDYNQTNYIKSGVKVFR